VAIVSLTPVPLCLRERGGDRERLQDVARPEVMV
jgi:hypothetical protein